MTEQLSVAIIGTRGYPSYYGGFETAVRSLAPHLAAHDWDVVVYGRAGATRDDDPNMDPRVHRVVTRGSHSRSFSTLSHGFWAVLDAARRRPRVAFVMNVANGFWLPLLRLRGIPTVVNVDGLEWQRGKWGRVARTAFRWGAWLTAKFSTVIVVDAAAIGDVWETTFRRKGVYIPYGAEVPTRVAPVEDGLTPGTYALVVARFVPENSITEFLEAAETLAERHDIVIVGSSAGSELEADVARLASTNPRIRWLGHIEDDERLCGLWQNSGAYFHGHSVGGTNPALVQAIACGAPVVARDTVFNREVLGDEGIFVDPDPRAIARAIDTLLSSPEAQRVQAKRGQQRAVDLFSPDAINESYRAVLEKAAR